MVIKVLLDRSPKSKFANETSQIRIRNGFEGSNCPHPTLSLFILRKGCFNWLQKLKFCEQEDKK